MVKLIPLGYGSIGFPVFNFICLLFCSFIKKQYWPFFNLKKYHAISYVIYPRGIWVRISSTFSVRPTLLKPAYFTSTFLSQLYFDPNFISTFLSQLYFDLFGQTLLLPLYFNKKSRFDKRSKYRGRSKRVEVQKGGRRYENGRSTEKVKLIRTREYRS